MFWWGIKLVSLTWNQTISDFPWYSVGASYLPVPIGGLITALFVIERLWTSNLFEQPDEGAISPDQHRVSRHGHGHPDRRLLHPVPARDAGRLRARVSRRSSRRCGSTSRSKPSCSRHPTAWTTSRCSRSRSSSSPAASWPKAAWRTASSISPRCSSDSSAAALSLVNILASTMFGCISGSSVADTAAIGSVMIPQMIKAGYPRLFAVNVTIAGSLQPLLIPPSHNAVIYSLAAGGTISVAHLFIAGIIPGLMLGLSLMILCFYIARRDNFPKGEVIPLRQALKIAGEAIWGLLHHRHHHRRHPVGHLHADRVRRGRLHLLVPGHDVHLSRLQMERAAAAGRPRRAHGRHGDDHDRVLDRLRLHDGDHADPGEDHRVLRFGFQQQVRVPAAHQHAAAGARHVHGSRADAA